MNVHVGCSRIRRISETTLISILVVPKSGNSLWISVHAVPRYYELRNF